MPTGGKKERRSRRDRARARRTKLGPSERRQKSVEQQAIEKALHKERKEKGQAGLAGAGRGTVIPSKKQKAQRPWRKRKHKGRKASAQRVASAYLARRSHP